VDTSWDLGTSLFVGVILAILAGGWIVFMLSEAKLSS
jgi:hypothetical protein